MAAVTSLSGLAVEVNELFKAYFCVVLAGSWAWWGHACNLGACEAEAGGSQLQDWSGIHSEVFPVNK